jgi:hypothetical protein
VRKKKHGKATREDKISTVVIRDEISGSHHDKYEDDCLLG